MNTVSNDPDVKSEVMQIILNISKSLAKKKEGALFVIADPVKMEGNHKPHYPQLKFGGNILSKGMPSVVERLATLDGAIVISPEGDIIAYGTRILKSETLIGFGTKHAAAKGITLYDKSATAILVSEESNWIKVFQNGEIVLETDAVDIEPSTLEKVSSFLANRDMALLAGAGISVAAGLSQLLHC
jgi:DNA integrity scanning protein DisA with diadenylate cyclase activity